MAQRVSLAGGATKTTSYLVDESASYAQVVEERAPDVNDAGAPQLQARYVLGQGLAPLAMWRKGADGAVKLFYFVSDGQESVRQLTDALGAVTDSYFYDAWGNALSGGSGTTVNPFRYTGQQLDPDGKYFLRARFYDPTKGRFLNHDPMMGHDDDPSSDHRYLYAGADGINGCDPSGLETLGEIINVEAVQDILQAGIADVSKRILLSAAGGAAIGAASFHGLGLTPLEGAVEGGRIGGELSLAESMGGNTLAEAVVNGFVTGTILYMAKYIYDAAIEPENLNRPNYRNEGLREFVRGFASGVEDEVLDGFLKEKYQPLVAAVGVLFQDWVNTSDGESVDHFWESAADAAAQALLDLGADTLAKEYFRGDPELVEKITNNYGANIFDMVKEAHKDAALLAFSSVATGVTRSIVNAFLPHGAHE